MHEIKCPWCGGERFEDGRVQAVTQGSGMLVWVGDKDGLGQRFKSLNFGDQKVKTRRCETCGHIGFYYVRPSKSR